LADRHPLPFQRAIALCCALSLLPVQVLPAQSVAPPQKVFGYGDFSAQAKIDQSFMAVPDAKLAGEDLKTLTAAPHVAGSKEDYATAEFVAQKFKAGGLETSIVPYKVWRFAWRPPAPMARF
jgi:N-acetylated-alpha-linked acidic dipeptidase